MDPSSSQTYIKQHPQDNSKSNENKDGSQTQIKSQTNFRNGQEKNDIGQFKDSELQTIEFIADNIKYQLDPRYMLWSTELLKQDKPQDQNAYNYQQENQSIKKKSHKFMDLKKLYEHNKSTIEGLNKELNDLELARQKTSQRLYEVKQEKERMRKIFKVERTKTENLKGCKERLDKLKKELGF
ncbi:unnamed protein product [Paramecium primaurelia]|uniref:Uncharacterized protein n=1 Tax=Paramecium primaurelia TaxID=5886 RepID=A0A8S1P273_PARPR|nr:unnamed protein product [Paramecium primaurelia]